MPTNPFNSKQLNYRSYIATVRGLYEKPVTQASTALILTLLTIAFFGVAAIKPTFVTVTQLESELKEKREIEAKMHDKLASLAEIQVNYLENQDLLKVYDRAIPDESKIQTFIIKIEYLFSESPVILKGVQVLDWVTYGQLPVKKTEDEDSIPYQTTLLSLSVDGSYEDLMAVLDRVSKIDRYVQIESITFDQPNEEDDEYALNMGVRLRIFWNESENKGS